MSFPVSQASLQAVGTASAAVGLERERMERTAMVIGTVGIGFALLFAALYSIIGSPISGLAITAVSVGLAIGLFALRRGASLVLVANISIALTWLATFVAVSRTGGFGSPALAWTFLLPLLMFSVFGRRAATAWAALSAFQIVTIFVAERSGQTWSSDLAPGELDTLRLVGYVGCVAAAALALASSDSARRSAQTALDQANRALDRQRILGDMHDGVGSQLLGLLVQARAGKLEPTKLTHGLESCLDDLRLIVDSLDPLERPFALSLAELRDRLDSRCEASNVTLEWDVALADADSAGLISSDAALQILRTLQELTNNALRHSGAGRISVIGAPATTNDGGGRALRFEVRDDGCGFEPGEVSMRGRGVPSVQTRAAKLGATLRFERVSPGTRVELLVPLASAGGDRRAP